MSSDTCSCGSGKRPLGVCVECGRSYCSECKFTHQYTPQPMNTADFLYSTLGGK